MINQLGHINQQLGNDIHIGRMYVSTTHLYHGYDQHLGVSVQSLSVDVEPVLSSWFERQQPLLKQSCTSNKKPTHLTSSSYPLTIGMSDMTSKFPNNKIATDTASETFLDFSAGLFFLATLEPPKKKQRNVSPEMRNICSWSDFQDGMMYVHTDEFLMWYINTKSPSGFFDAWSNFTNLNFYITLMLQKCKIFRHIMKAWHQCRYIMVSMYK